MEKESRTTWFPPSQGDGWRHARVANSARHETKRGLKLHSISVRLLKSQISLKPRMPPGLVLAPTAGCAGVVLRGRACLRFLVRGFWGCCRFFVDRAARQRSSTTDTGNITRHGRSGFSAKALTIVGYRPRPKRRPEDRILVLMAFQVVETRWLVGGVGQGRRRKTARRLLLRGEEEEVESESTRRAK